MDYILATHNMKKRDELHRILSPLGIKVHLAEELGIELTDAEETGETFEENAYIKAESGCRESGYPCIADDSGLSQGIRASTATMRRITKNFSGRSKEFRSKSAARHSSARSAAFIPTEES